MSGGSLNYSYEAIEHAIELLYHVQSSHQNAQEVKDEIKELIGILTRSSNNLFRLEWYLSGDISLQDLKGNWLNE